MSVRKITNIHAQAQAEAQLAADIQGNTEAQQVPAPQVIGAKSVIVRGPPLFGATGVYRTPATFRVGAPGIIRQPGLLGTTGVYTTTSAGTVATKTYPADTLLGASTRVIHPAGTTLVQTAPAPTGVVSNPSGFSPLLPLSPEKLALINSFKPAIERVIAGRTSVWVPEGVQIRAVDGVDSRFYVRTEFGIIQATIRTGLDQISVLTLVYPELGDAYEPTSAPADYTPPRALTTEEMTLIEQFRSQIVGGVEELITEWEVNAVQARAGLSPGIYLRFLINTNVGLLQSTILIDLQGKPSFHDNIIAKPLLVWDPNIPYAEYCLPYATSILDQEKLELIRVVVEEFTGLTLTIWEPLTTQYLAPNGTLRFYLIKTNLGICSATLSIGLSDGEMEVVEIRIAGALPQ